MKRSFSEWVDIAAFAAIVVVTIPIWMTWGVVKWLAAKEENND